MNRIALATLLALVALGILLSVLVIGSDSTHSAAAALAAENMKTETPAVAATPELKPLEARPELATAGLTAPLPEEAMRAHAPVAGETSSKTMVHILLIGGDTGEPIEGVNVRLATSRRWRVVNGPSTGKAGDSLTSDAKGRVSFEVLPGTDLKCSVRAGGARYEDTNLEVTQLAANEVRRIEVALVRGTKSTDHFRLIDQETHAHLAGAKITGPAPHYSGRETHLFSQFLEEGNKIVAESDADGQFQLPYDSLVRAEYLVHTDGHSPAFAVPLGKHPKESAPEVVAVSRAASLTGTIVADGQNELKVRASAHGYAFIDSISPEDFLVTKYGWEVDVGPGGHYILPALPPNIHLDVEVLVGWEVLYKHPVSLFLSPGEQGDFDWSASLAATVSGVLVDQARAVDGRQLWLLGREQLRAHKILQKYDEPDHKAVTTIDGSFVFEGVTAGDYWLGESPKTIGADTPGQLVHVPTEVPVVLTIEPPLTIRGRVIFEGKGVANARLLGWRDDLDGRLTAETDAEGRFELKPHVPGLWRVTAHPDNRTDGLVPRGINEFEAGAEDVVIELTRGVQFAGRLEDAQGNAISAQVSLLDRRSNRAVVATRKARSTFKFYTVLPGRYALYAQSPNGFAGLSADMDVAPGDLRNDLVIRLEPAATLVLEAAQNANPPHVWLFQGSDLRAVLNLFDLHVGTFSVPAGNYRMELRDRTDGDATSATHLTLQTGQTTRLQLGGE